MNRIRLWLKQRNHTKRHRAEQRDGFRLALLDDQPIRTYIGFASWCDARLQDCPVPGHDRCCACRHFHFPPTASSSAA